MTTSGNGPENVGDALPQEPGMWPERPRTHAGTIDPTVEEAAASAIEARAAERERWVATPRGRLSTLWRMLPQWVHWLVIVLAFVAAAKGCEAVKPFGGGLSCPEDMNDADCRDFLGVDLNRW